MTPRWNACANEWCDGTMPASGASRPMDPDLVTNHDPCDDHEEGPSSYTAWHAWAARKSKTHKQRRCPACGLWKIWEPR